MLNLPPHSLLYLLAVRSDRSYSRSLKSASRSNSTAQITKDLNREQCVRQVHSRSSFYQADNLVLASDKATVNHRPACNRCQAVSRKWRPRWDPQWRGRSPLSGLGMSACSSDPLPSPGTSQHTQPQQFPYLGMERGWGQSLCTPSHCHRLPWPVADT